MEQSLGSITESWLAVYVNTELNYNSFVALHENQKKRLSVVELISVWCKKISNRQEVRAPLQLYFYNFQAGYVNYYLMEEGKSCVKMALRVGQEYRVSKITTNHKPANTPWSTNQRAYFH